MNPLNLKPYTVTFVREHKADWATFSIMCHGETITTFTDTGTGRADLMATLLNDAYTKGVEAGQRAALIDAHVHITDLGDLVCSGDSPFNTSDRLGRARRFIEETKPILDGPFAAISPDSGMTPELRTSINDHEGFRAYLAAQPAKKTAMEELRDMMPDLEPPAKS